MCFPVVPLSAFLICFLFVVQVLSCFLFSSVVIFPASRFLVVPSLILFPLSVLVILSFRGFASTTSLRSASILPDSIFVLTYCFPEFLMSIVVDVFRGCCSFLFPFLLRFSSLVCGHSSFLIVLYFSIDRFLGWVSFSLVHGVIRSCFGVDLRQQAMKNGN